MILIRPPMRTTDTWGSGHFGAPRGSRKHMGVDFACLPGSEVLASCGGQVSKLGYPYADDLTYRYVEVLTEDNHRVRYFYVSPAVQAGDYVEPGDTLGTVQPLGRRYAGITEHVHVEVWTPLGERIDPVGYLHG